MTSWTLGQVKGKETGRARQIVMETIAILSQKYNVPEPRVVFRPMEYEGARFRPPKTLNIEETFAQIVDTAKTENWDRFLKVVVAHEFKHYLQYLELGRPLTSIPESEYRNLESDAWEFSFAFVGVPLTAGQTEAWAEFQQIEKMRALASEIMILYIVDERPLEEAISIATKTLGGLIR